MTEIPRLVRPRSISAELAEAMERAMMTGGIENCVITRADGLPIAHNFADAVRAKHMAAMSAAIVGAARVATQDLGKGSLNGITVDSEHGRIVCIQAGDQAIVAGLTPSGANVGLALLALRTLAADVSRIIEEWETADAASYRVAAR